MITNAFNFPVINPADYNDKQGFDRHCEVAAMTYQMGFAPHTKHHFREAIRQASYKVTERPGKKRKSAHYISEAAMRHIRDGKKDGLEADHIVPIQYIVNHLYEFAATKPGQQDMLSQIKAVVSCYSRLAIVTKEEHGQLSKVRWSFPFSGSVFDRYQQLDIELLLNDSTQAL